MPATSVDLGRERHGVDVATRPAPPRRTDLGDGAPAAVAEVPGEDGLVQARREQDRALARERQGANRRVVAAGPQGQDRVLELRPILGPKRGRPDDLRPLPHTDLDPFRG